MLLGAGCVRLTTPAPPADAPTTAPAAPLPTAAAEPMSPADCAKLLESTEDTGEDPAREACEKMIGETNERDSEDGESDKTKAEEQKSNKSAGASFKGAQLAGAVAPLLEFNAVDYARSLQSGKLIVLYFYANWCPICKKEFPELVDAFNQLSTDQVIGFRVNFNDNATDEVETNLAREYGVAYQHTKVFVKNGERLLKSPDSWDQQRYLLEIMKAL